MLLRIGVSNHRSIREGQELSLTASSLKDRDEGLIACPAAPNGSIVPAVVIYGANASGKSNLIDAIGTMRSMVLESHTKGEPGGGVPRSPFALDATSSTEPSRFEIDFVMGGVRHHYGFEASDKAFESEWLYTFPKGHRRMLFERNGNKFHFGRALSGPNNIIAELTRRNSLYVSAAVQNDHKQLFEVYEFFRSFRSVRDISISGEQAWEYLGHEEPDQRVIEFLGKVGTGIIGHRRKETDVPEEIQAFQRALSRIARSVLSGEIEIRGDTEDKKVRIELGHLSHEGEPVYFELNRESAGTRRLLIVLGYAFRALDEGLPLCIDELDASVHTHACEAVLDLFCSPKTNRRGAQLIATTHDTNVMNPLVLRRDQLWLTEKGADGATQLYPLTDFRTRKGDDFEKGYLQGRYGGVPSNDLIMGRGSES